MTYAKVKKVTSGKEVLFWLVGLIDQVVAVGRDREGGSEGFVEGSLPPLVEVVAVPTQAFGRELVASEIEDADLLAFHGAEGAMAAGWREEAVVGEHGSIDIHLAKVAHQQADIAEGMVYAQTCGTKVGQAVPTL